MKQRNSLLEMWNKRYTKESEYDDKPKKMKLKKHISQKLTLDNYFISEAEKNLNYEAHPPEQIQNKIDQYITPYIEEEAEDITKPKIIRKFMEFELDDQYDNQFGMNMYNIIKRQKHFK